MQSSIDIRKVQQKDKEIYINMMKDFYNSDVVLQPIPINYMENTFELAVLDSPYVDSFIVYYNDEAAGYILLSLTYSNEAGGLTLWIEEIYILPEFQGKGLGKAVFNFIEMQYSKKVSRIRLEVEEKNQKAIEMYSKIGYKKLEYMQMYKGIES